MKNLVSKLALMGALSLGVVGCVTGTSEPSLQKAAPAASSKTAVPSQVDAITRSLPVCTELAATGVQPTDEIMGALGYLPVSGTFKATTKEGNVQITNSNGFCSWFVVSSGLSSKDVKVVLDQIEGLGFEIIHTNKVGDVFLERNGKRFAFRNLEVMKMSSLMFKAL